MTYAKDHKNNEGLSSFDPKAFLATAGVGRKILKHAKKEIIFTQGDNADAVFYITKGKVKVTVLSKDGRKPL